MATAATGRRVAVPRHQARRPRRAGRHQRPGQPRRRWSWRSTICRRCSGTPSSDSRWRTCGRAPTTVGPSSTGSTRPTARGPAATASSPTCASSTARSPRAMEDELLRVIAEYDGRPFPKLARPGSALARRPLPPRGHRSGGVLRPTARHHLPTAWACSTRSGPSNWYDPGRFWSGDRLPLAGWRQPRRSRSPFAGDPAIARTIARARRRWWRS